MPVKEKFKHLRKFLIEPDNKTLLMCVVKSNIIITQRKCLKIQCALGPWAVCGLSHDKCQDQAEAVTIKHKLNLIILFG